MVEDIEVKDIENTIILLENLSDTPYFRNSSITDGMIEALSDLLQDYQSIWIDSNLEKQEALNKVLDSD